MGKDSAKELRTLLDVINRGLERQSARAPVVRLLYVGEHSLDAEALLTLDAGMRRCWERCQRPGDDAPAHGALLACPRHYLVAIEGSELTLARHVRLIHEDDVLAAHLGSAKALAAHHGCAERRFTTWSSLMIDDAGDDDDKGRRDALMGASGGVGGEALEECVRRCVEAAKLLCGIEEAEDQISRHSLLQNIADSLDFDDVRAIIASPSVLDLRDYAALYMSMPNYSYSFETCWPAPFDFAPSSKDDAQVFGGPFVELLSDIGDFDVVVEKEEEEKRENDEEEEENENEKLPDGNGGENEERERKTSVQFLQVDQKESHRSASSSDAEGITDDGQDATDDGQEVTSEGDGDVTLNSDALSVGASTEKSFQDD